MHTWKLLKHKSFSLVVTILKATAIKTHKSWK